MKILAAMARAFTALLLIGTLHAQVPQFLNYQGRVAVNGVNFDGAGQFKFALVDAAGTTTYWSNDGTSTAGSQPAAAVTIAVSKGLYSVLLGNTALPNMIAVPATVFANPDVKLRVWFNDGTNGSQLITPDQPIAAVGYAMRSATAAAAGYAGYAGSAGTVYGDGSAGDYTAPIGDTSLEVSNPQFNNFTVPAGATLHVPSGLTIRCANTFTNHGTVIVDPTGGGVSSTSASAVVFTTNRGIARTAASRGGLGLGGKAYARSQLKAIFSIDREGGGTGSPGYNETTPALGGGALCIIAQGILQNTGEIRAVGEDGIAGIFTLSQRRYAGGGGGGGVVILASAISLVQNGVVDVSGRAGGTDAVDTQPSYSRSVGPGGAGGGGLIRLLSPQITSAGQNKVSAGAKRPVLPATYPGGLGGGGGASAGNGAGYISDTVIEDAGDGLVLIDLCNPTALLGK